jgi:hypothetical protein
VEKTLVQRTHLYKPVALGECSVTSDRMQARITAAQPGPVIEPSFYYAAKLNNSSSETPGFFLAPLPNNDNDISVSFSIRGDDTEPFINQCTAKRLDRFVLIPHACFPMDRETSNANFDSAR